MVAIAALTAGCAHGESAQPAAANASTATTAAPATPTSTAAVTSAPANVTVHATSDHYTLDDLRALEKQKAWTELVDHLADIAPSQRDASWQALADEASVALLTTIATDHEAFAALATADDLTKRYPTLTSSKAFMAKRAEVGIRGFEACYDHSRTGGNCTERLLGFVEADPSNSELAMNAGRLVTRKQFVYTAVPFFRVAVVGKESQPGTAARCASDELKRAVRAALDDTGQDAVLYPQARQVQSACMKAK